MTRPVVVKPASKRTTTSRSITEELNSASRPAAKLLTIQHAAPVVRSMQSAKANARRPSVQDSRNIRLPDNEAKYRNSYSPQPASPHATTPLAAVRWQPPQALQHREGHAEKSIRGLKLSSLLSTGEGEELDETRREHKAVPLDGEHLAANAIIDELHGMFRPTLARFGRGASGKC